MKKLRSVRIKTWIPTPKPGRWSDDFNRKGLFHKWGHAYEEFESGPGNYTVAIVEFPDGHVEEIPVPRIIFVDLIK